jgi:hypothetical protein
MPSSIGVAKWSDLSAEEIVAIRAHAAMKSDEIIDWESWLRLDAEERWGFDVPYSMSEVLNIVLENVADMRNWSRPCFVPYRFDFERCEEWPPPSEFWRDDVRPEGWRSEYLTIISARWVLINWQGTHDREYRAMAEQFANKFMETYIATDGPESEDRFKDEYHYVEVGLMQCLEYAANCNLAVIVYP